jgi:hypothetical protein
MISRDLGSVCIGSILALGSIFASACAPLRLPYKSDSPVAAAHDGVQLAVTRQSCIQEVDPEFYGSDLVEEVVEVQIRNAISDPLMVQREAFHLISPDGHWLEAMTWRAVEPLSVNAGETRTFELRYMTRGGLECTREMKLDADAGVRVNGRAIRIGAVSFQPSRAL